MRRQKFEGVILCCKDICKKCNPSCTNHKDGKCDLSTGCRGRDCGKCDIDIGGHDSITKCWSFKPINGCRDCVHISCVDSCNNKEVLDRMNIDPDEKWKKCSHFEFGLKNWRENQCQECGDDRDSGCSKIPLLELIKSKKEPKVEKKPLNHDNCTESEHCERCEHYPMNKEFDMDTKCGQNLYIYYKNDDDSADCYALQCSQFKKKKCETCRYAHYNTKSGHSECDTSPLNDGRGCGSRTNYYKWQSVIEDIHEPIKKYDDMGFSIRLEDPNVCCGECVHYSHPKICNNKNRNSGNCAGIQSSCRYFRPKGISKKSTTVKEERRCSECTYSSWRSGKTCPKLYKCHKHSKWEKYIPKVKKSNYYKKGVEIHQKMEKEYNKKEVDKKMAIISGGSGYSGYYPYYDSKTTSTKKKEDPPEVKVEKEKSAMKKNIQDIKDEREKFLNSLDVEGIRARDRIKPEYLDYLMNRRYITKKQYKLAKLLDINFNQTTKTDKITRLYRRNVNFRKTLNIDLKDLKPYSKWEEIGHLIGILKIWREDYLLQKDKDELKQLTICFKDLSKPKTDPENRTKRGRKICEDCGTKNVIEAKFCRECGVHFEF
jgi:hypothetical protein